MHANLIQKQTNKKGKKHHGFYCDHDPCYKQVHFEGYNIILKSSLNWNQVDQNVTAKKREKEIGIVDQQQS